MIAPLDIPAAPSWPSITVSRRKLSSDRPAYVDDTCPTEYTVVVEAKELTDRGAYYLYTAMRNTLKRGHWRNTTAGLLLPDENPIDSQTVRSWPPVTFESVKLNRKAPVMIIDHPKELHVLIDKRELTTDGAAALTAAVRTQMAKGQWRRGQAGLWLTA